MMPQVEKVSRIKVHQRYYVDDKRVPGATTITGILAKPALIRWANQMGLKGIDTSQYVRKLADAGTLAHWMIEAHWLGTKVDTASFTAEQIVLAENSFLSYLEWAKHKDIEVYNVELQLTSRSHRYGGTVDCVCCIDGAFTVLDLKTSKAIYDEHLYQVAAYWHLVDEKRPFSDWPPIMHSNDSTIRILQIGRGEDENWSEKVIKGEEIQKYWKVFKKACDLYHAIRAAKRR